MKSILATLIAVACFTTLCLGQDKGSYSFKETLKAGSLPYQLSISSNDGNIEVQAGTGNTVEVLYIVKKNGIIRSMSRQELEKDYIVEQSSTDNSLRINVKNRIQNSFHFNNSMSVNFRITVPAQTESTLRTSDGDVEVSGTNGAIDIGTSDGNINIENTSGSLQSVTSDGNIVLAQVTGDISVTTSDGNITFNNVSGSFRGVTSDGNIRGNMVKVGNEITAKTGDGNIDVTVPDHLGLDLNIHGESLHVPLDNFSGKSNDSSIQGKSNGGGIAVTLTTSDGHVKLTYF